MYLFRLINIKSTKKENKHLSIFQSDLIWLAGQTRLIDVSDFSNALHSIILHLCIILV